MEMVNRILDKISAQGKDSLTPEEKEYLDKYFSIGKLLNFKLLENGIANTLYRVKMQCENKFYNVTIQVKDEYKHYVANSNPINFNE
jgi:hypothetical protein